MSVSREDFERSVAELRAEIEDPRAGLYGPGSISWEIGKESILFVAGGRAALLQLAHPYVAHAIDQHSQTRTDPMGRFQRTFDAVFAMVFGDLDSAIHAARRVHAIHRRVTGAIGEDVGRFQRGDRYEANDEEALFWVHATLIDSAILAYDRVVRRLSYAEKDRYYQESKRFARLFGIHDRTMPADWSAFQAYNRRLWESPTLAVGAPALEMSRFLFASPSRVHAPLFAWARVMTAGLMPERLRREFRLPWGPAERAAFRASLGLLRGIWPALPRRLRYAPAYVAARRRLAGKHGPDRFGIWLERLALIALDARQGRASQG